MIEQDKRLWFFWAGLVLVVVVLLPFLVRMDGFFSSVLAYCLSVLGPA